MAEFDEKLNSILSNPDAMSQIMQLAQALSGDGQSFAASPEPPLPPPASPDSRARFPAKQQCPPAVVCPSALSEERKTG